MEFIDQTCRWNQLGNRSKHKSHPKEKWVTGIYTGHKLSSREKKPYHFNSDQSAFEDRTIQVLYTALCILAALHGDKGESARFFATRICHKVALQNLMQSFCETYSMNREIFWITFFSFAIPYEAVINIFPGLLTKNHIHKIMHSLCFSS